MMNLDAFFEPTFAAYVRYCIGYCIRYFAIAGSLYMFFHIAFKRQWFPYRIQSVFPSRADVGHAIRWSMTNAACTGLATIWLYHLIRTGKTQMYFAVGDYGWMYFLFSIALGIAGYDAWFYWQHRLLHTPWL